MGTATRRRTMRVTETTHRILRELAGQSGDSMTVIVERAVERYQREQLITEANEAWAALQADPATMADIDAEQALWEQTLGDGLEREEW
jgi:hypothetical protein